MHRGREVGSARGRPARAPLQQLIFHLKLSPELTQRFRQALLLRRRIELERDVVPQPRRAGVQRRELRIRHDERELCRDPASVSSLKRQLTCLTLDPFRDRCC